MFINFDGVAIKDVGISTGWFSSTPTVTIALTNGDQVQIEPTGAPLGGSINIDDVGGIRLPATVKSTGNGLMVADGMGGPDQMTEDQLQIVDGMVLDSINVSDFEGEDRSGTADMVGFTGTIDLDRVGGLLLRSNTPKTGKHEGSLVLSGMSARMPVGVGNRKRDSCIKFSYE